MGRQISPVDSESSPPRYSRRGSKLSAESEPVKAARACAWSTKAEMKTTEHHVVESSGDPSRIVPFPSPVSRPYDLLCFVLYGAQNQTLPEMPPMPPLAALASQSSAVRRPG